MFGNRVTFAMAAVAAAALLVPGAYAQEAAPTSVEELIKDWPDVSKKAAQEMKAKYGEPDGMTSSAVIWENNGPWKMTVVYKEPIDHDFPKPHQDVLHQEVLHSVPTEKFDELAEYDGSVVAARTFGTLAARCDKEAMNFLALNLAHQLINDEVTVEEARQAYADNVQKFMAGEKPEITQKLLFPTEQPQVARDPDQAIMETQTAQKPSND